MAAGSEARCSLKLVDQFGNVAGSAVDIGPFSALASFPGVADIPAVRVATPDGDRFLRVSQVTLRGVIKRRWILGGAQRKQGAPRATRAEAMAAWLGSYADALGDGQEPPPLILRAQHPSGPPIPLTPSPTTAHPSP